MQQWQVNWGKQCLFDGWMSGVCPARDEHPIRSTSIHPCKTRAASTLQGVKPPTNGALCGRSVQPWVMFLLMRTLVFCRVSVSAVFVDYPTLHIFIKWSIGMFCVFWSMAELVYPDIPYRGGHSSGHDCWTALQTLPGSPTQGSANHRPSVPHSLPESQYSL